VKPIQVISDSINTAARRRSLMFPREHGAWGIVLIPLLTGAFAGLSAGGRAWPLAPLAVAALSLFWLRTPAEIWLGTAAVHARTPAEVQAVRRAVFSLTGLSAAGLICLFWNGRHPLLVGIGAAAAIAFLAQILVRQIWRSVRIAAQMIGAAGLTATAPAAYYVSTGRLNQAAWTLWIANLLFALNQIHFVQLRIHAARAVTPHEKLVAGRAFLTGQTLLIMALAAASSAHFFSWYGSIAFLPVLFRGFAWFVGNSKSLAIRELGWRELVHAAVFAVLLVIGMELP
jgi:YwiC-like protein